MSKKQILCATVTALVVSLSPAFAATGRTFVSGQGTDSGSCAVTAPCRTFAYAVAQTAAAGEVVVLDSAGYGPLTITQSITITNPGGVEAGITASSDSDAVTINAASSATVTLRGLTLEGGGGGANGVHLIANPGGAVNIIDCVAKDFTNSGFNLPYSGSGALTVSISGAYALNNANDGMYVGNLGSGQYTYSISSTITQENKFGIEIGGDSSSALIGEMSNITANLNFFDGFLFSGSSASTAVIRHSSSFALYNKAEGAINIQNTVQKVYMFDRNYFDVVYNSGTLYTDGTNNIFSINGNSATTVSPQ